MKFIDFGSESDFIRNEMNFRKMEIIRNDSHQADSCMCGLSPGYPPLWGTNMANTAHPGPVRPGVQEESTEEASCPQLDHRMTFCASCVLNPACKKPQPSYFFLVKARKGNEQFQPSGRRR